MDQRLVAWARAVKARRRRNGRGAPPTLWLFTDARRLPDPLPAVARLPRGLAGVVLRHDGEPGRLALGRALAVLCRERRLLLVVAGDTRLARRLGAGVHLRDGRWPGPLRAPGRIVTSSAHGPADLRRAQRAGATLGFLSPAFPTLSHPDSPALGPHRWSRAARAAPRLAVFALGGATGTAVTQLPRAICAGAGSIGALSDRKTGRGRYATVFRDCPERHVHRIART